MPFAEFVDYVCQQLLHRHSTHQLLQACCTATGIQPTDIFHANHAQFTVAVPRVLATLIDTPEFLSR